MNEWLAYGGLGAFAGVLAGLFGVGGGLVIVPVLAWLFLGAGMNPVVIMHLAIGTSLATIVFTSISSVYAHHRRGAVQWYAFTQLSPGIVLGAWLGAVIADSLPSTNLRLIFGVFELLVAAQMGFGLKVSPHRTLPGRPGMALAGGVIGTVSAIVGIGGGTMTVPFLQWCNVEMRKAVATSAACGLPIAVAGALGFVVSGWNEVGLPPMSSGYLYWPALGGIVVASMLFAPLGARLAHALPAAQLKRWFALFLAFLGIKMLFF
jgi:uncharacterized membrane protein YfcA